MMKRLKEFFRRKCKNQAGVLGLFFGLAVLAVLLPGIFSAQRLGTLDNGSYEPTMQVAGLCYLETDLAEPETLYFDHVIEEYGYGSFSWWKLLGPNGQSSVIYPVALIRLLTEPFGRSFSTVYLALVYSLLYALGTYVLVRSCAHLAGWLGAIPGTMLLLAASSRNLLAYFNSLYPTAAVIVGLLLMIAMALRLFTYGKNTGLRGMLGFLAAAAFCLNASELCLIFAPFAAAVVLAVLLRDWEEKSLKPGAAACAVVLVLAAVSSSSQQLRSSYRYQSNISSYQSAFVGFLKASDDPVSDLQEFGLEESYAEDVGKSYYLSGDSFRHDPHDKQEAKLLFEKLNAGSVGKWYLRHPLRLLQTANRQEEAFNSFESDMALELGLTGKDALRVNRSWSLADTLMKMLLPEDYNGAFVCFLLGLAAAAWVSFRLLRKGRGKAFSITAGISGACLALGCFGYVLLHLRYLGQDSLFLARMVGVFGILLSIGLLSVAAGDCLYVLSDWFREKQQLRIEDRGLSLWQFGTLPQPKAHSLGSSRWGSLSDRPGSAAFLVFLVALAMSAIVQFVGVRAGCVNNGDFGRMMDQLGLIWQGDIFYNVDAQLGRRVIEDYAFRDAFDWTSLTFLNPKYSLIYPASLVRLFCNLTGQDFSTWYLSLVMNAVLIACLVSIVYDLHGLLGRYAVLLGMGLCAVFFCESYLVWFNSLFGESCMLMGLFMVIACCVHLAVKPANKCWPTVLLLLFSARVLVCAKAQMLVTLPFVLILVILFALYQRPLPLKGLIPYILTVMVACVIITSDCITVYRDNSGISERQTVWQATFYGALMISDDPEATMEELGIDKRMLPDIGKDAYQADEDYVISPNSPEADAALYDHVNTFTMVKYYLRHPVQLYKMLNHAASASRTVYNEFRAYLGQDYSQPHDTVQKLGAWLYWRYFFTCGSFLGYVLLYGAAMAAALFVIFGNRERDGRWKMLSVVFLWILLTGAVQFPISVIGNGFADNHKQMFGFMMCHDFLVVFSLTILVRYLKMHGTELMNRLQAAR